MKVIKKISKNQYIVYSETELDLGTLLQVSKKDKLNQQLRLIWDYLKQSVCPSYRKINNNFKLYDEFILEKLMIDNGLSKEGLFFVPELNRYFLGQTRRSLKIDKNNKSSYNRIIKLLQDFHQEIDYEAFIDYWNYTK